MLDQSAIKQLATKLQTTELNIAREYCQHLVLQALFEQPLSSQMLFKGGTALKIIYNSPRFSEDLDFSSNLTTAQIKALIAGSAHRFEQENIICQIIESKPTSGGYFAKLQISVYKLDISIEFNVSTRSKKEIKSESHLITFELAPSYSLSALEQQFLVKEKIQALLTRSKPRDYFDLYFILRHNLVLPKNITAYLPKLKDKIKRQNNYQELKNFLPINYHLLLKNFKDTLLTELNRRFPE